MSNARIAPVMTGLNSEWIATDIHLRYNPATKSMGVDFHFQQFLVPENSDTLPYSSDKWEVVSYDMSALAQRLVGQGVTDPVTTSTLGFLSGAGVAEVFRKLADQLYNEDAAAKAAAAGVE